MTEPMTVLHPFRLALPVVSVCLLTGLLGDITTTFVVVLRFGPYLEANPLARWLFLHGGPVLVASIVLGLWVVISLCLRRINRRRPQRGRKWVLAMGNVAALRWLVLIWNILQLRQAGL